jgi:hypothetical protein
MHPIIFATFLLNVALAQTFEKQAFYDTSCGYYGQLCCPFDTVCATDAYGRARCSALSSSINSPSLGSGSVTKPVTSTGETRTALYTCPSSSSGRDGNGEQFTFYTCDRDFGLSKSRSATTGTRILSSNGDGTTSTLMTGAESATPTSSVAESGTVSPSSAVMTGCGGVMEALNFWYSLAMYGVGVIVVMSS